MPNRQIGGHGIERVTSTFTVCSNRFRLFTLYLYSDTFCELWPYFLTYRTCVLNLIKKKVVPGQVYITFASKIDMPVIRCCSYITETEKTLETVSRRGTIKYY